MFFDNVNNGNARTVFKIAVPGKCANLTYNGSSQTLAINGSNVNYSNNTATNAGSYTVTVTASPNYIFSDGTTSKKLTCTISIKSIEVTFNSKGGSVSPSTKTVSYGEAYGELPTPTKEGYNFEGWYDGEIPSTYQEIEYIESTGTQYIDTGYKHNQNTRMLADIDFQPSGSWKNPFGSWGGPNVSPKKMFGVQYDGDTGLALFYGNDAKSIFGKSLFTGRKIWDFNKNVWKIGSNTYTFAAQTFQSTINDYIFANTGYDGAVSGQTNVKVYSFKIYDGDTLVRDYVPVRRKSDNVGGLYDKVTGTFYGNSGTGNFNIGNDVGTNESRKVTSSTIVTTASNHQLHADWKINTYTLTYDFNTLNNMDSWENLYKNSFNITYDESSKINTVALTGIDGWENVYMPISTVANKTYKIEFDYINPNGYTPLSGFTGIGIQALTKVDNSDNRSNSLKTEYLSTTKNASTQHITFTFTATGTTTYFNFNFGMASDGVTTTIKLGKFKITESVKYNTSLTSLPNLNPSGYTFNGYYTESSGGSNVPSITMPANNYTVYAQSTKNAQSTITTKACYCCYCTNGYWSCVNQGEKTEGNCTCGNLAYWGYTPNKPSWCKQTPTTTKKSCFLAGTKVKTIYGFKNIEKIAVGDLVLSYNETTGKNEYKQVDKVFIHKNNTEDLYSLTIDNKVLKVTSAHRFYIKRGNKTLWLSASMLKVGDMVKYANGTYHKISNISYHLQSNTVYNFSVMDNHNYYVSDKMILVHNAKEDGACQISGSCVTP